MMVHRAWSKMKMIISKKIISFLHVRNNKLLLQMGGKTVPVLENTLISQMVKIGDLGGARSNCPDARSPRLTVIRFCIIAGQVAQR